MGNPASVGLGNPAPVGMSAHAPAGMGGPIVSKATQPQDIAQHLTVVSNGAFKIVALTDEQLREVTQKKTG